MLWHGLIGTLVICTVTLLCYSNSLHGDWAYDDNFAVVNNVDILPETPISNLLIHDFWGQDISKPDSHKSYRPLTTLSFRINYAFGAMDTYGYHVVNVVLHCIATAMVYTLSHMLFSDRWTSLVSGMLFGLHPIHTEAVSSIVGRAEVLCAVFYLPALFAFQKARETEKYGRKWLVFCYIGCFALATLSKETGYTVIGVMLFQNFLVDTSKSSDKQKKSNSNMVLAICGLSYIIVRTWLTSTFTLYNFRRLENPIAFAPLVSTRILSTAYLHTSYLSLLVLPTQLSADYSYDAIPLVESISDPRNLCTLFAYSSLTAALLFTSYGAFNNKNSERGDAGKVLWLLLIGVFSFLPASNLFFYVGTMLAERLLYIPSIPFCILIAWGSVRSVRKLLFNSSSGSPTQSNSTARPPRPPSSRTSPHPRSAFHIALGIVLVMGTASMCTWYAWRTHVRNDDWRGEAELFLSALEVCPGSAKVWQNIGILHRRTQNWPQAIEAFTKAKKIEPNYCELDYWFGITYLNMGHAELALEKLHNSLGCVYTQVQSVTALNKIYGVLISSAPSNSTYLMNWAKVLDTINRTHEASSYYYQAAIILHNQGLYNKSIPFLNRVVTLLALPDPPSPSVAMSKTDMACSAHLWLGAGYLSEGKLTEAVDHMREVAGMNTFLSTPTSLTCTALREQGRQTLGGLYVSQIKNGVAINAESRLELAIILAASGNVETAHYQYYEAASLLYSSGNKDGAQKVLTDALERTRDSSSLPSYKQITELLDTLLNKGLKVRAAKNKKDEL